MSCILSWILCKVIIHSPFQMPVTDSSSKLFAIINLAKLIRPFVTHLSTPLTRMNSAHSPNVSFFFQTFYLNCHSRAYHTTAPPQMLAEFLILFSFSQPVSFERGKQDRK